MLTVQFHIADGLNGKGCNQGDMEGKTRNDKGRHVESKLVLWVEKHTMEREWRKDNLFEGILTGRDDGQIRGHDDHAALVDIGLTARLYVASFGWQFCQGRFVSDFNMNVCEGLDGVCAHGPRGRVVTFGPKMFLQE